VIRGAGAAGWFPTRWRRLSGDGRIEGLDLARGMAVLGMLAAHLAEIPDVAWSDPQTWGGLVHGRSSILFATLAGVSIGLMTGGTRPLAGDMLRRARQRLAVRAGLLWLIGVALIATRVPVYVILPAYAILFLLALPFLTLRAGPLWCIVGALTLVTPFLYVWVSGLEMWNGSSGRILAWAIGWPYPFVVWIVFVLAGLAVARAGISRWGVQVALVTAGSGSAIIGYGLGELAPPSEWLAPVWTAQPHTSGVLEVIGSGGFALGLLGVCLLACRTPARWVVVPLRAVGSMPLTAYVGQLVVWAVVASLALDDVSDLTGMRELHPLAPFAIVTTVACTVWALMVGRGPLEWATDRVTRLAVRP